MESGSVTSDASPQAQADGPKRYAPAEIEAKWLQRWLDAGAFDAEPEQGDDTRPPYSIVIPPPNVTGALHMGHALNGSVQDALIRFKRMCGYNAVWIPGTDHAGIATQNVVEKELRKEGLTRHDLGRDRFVERVQQWKDEYGSTIIQQFKRLGCSLDYRRERFTMDHDYARAVQLVFVKLYDEGLIYRDNYLVNWCGRCSTAISDLEVRQVDVDDEMVQVDYPLADGGGHITVATVRPETIPADVAVAVNPNDERYRDLVGKYVRVPLTDRTVAIIVDDHVDPEFGTGALKITPGHDQNDFEIGLRHELPQLSAIEPDLTMTALTGRFAGIDVAVARKQMTAELEQLGVLRSREHYRHSVPHCDRCGTRVEPLISLQWFCDMSKLAQPALEAVRNGDVRFIPTGEGIFFSWMENIRPWCLSRQLWWGHQLPVWYCSGEDHHVHVSLDGPTGDCEHCGAGEWRRDDDVLDTWFSSGLWDFATLGWPDDTPELRYWHPTSVLLTARDIINLWVARMMMMSFHFLGEKPFSDVYVHSVIQAPDGRRMSKSLGTGIDPLDVIGQHGADATRYGLLTMSSTQDVRFNEGKIQEGRDLANKLWNASRLLVMLGDADALADDGAPHEPSQLEDRWIWSRVQATTAELTQLMERYEFALYTKQLYSFIWSEFCDWYLEAVKPRLRSTDAAERRDATRMTAQVLEVVVRLMHPVMPHVTEEIAAEVWGDAVDMVMCSHWPDAEHAHVDAAAERDFEQLRAAVSTLRSFRGAAELPPRQPLRVRAGELDPVLAGHLHLIATLANVEFVPDGEGIRVPVDGGTFTLLELDQATLRTRLEAELRDAQGEVTRAEGKLRNEKFVSRAPAELVEEERSKVARFGARARELDEVIAQLG